MSNCLSINFQWGVLSFVYLAGKGYERVQKELTELRNLYSYCGAQNFPLVPGTSEPQTNPKASLLPTAQVLKSLIYSYTPHSSQSLHQRGQTIS